MEDLLDAFDQLSKVSPAQLIVAGAPGGGARTTNPTPARARLANTPGVSAHIKFIPDEEVQVFFNAADVVILPYRAVLTSGSAILAISFGKPVIAPALGLITDLIRDGEEGLLYDPDEPGGLLRAMRRFLDLDARARTRMGAAARATAARLSWKKASGSLYLDALAGAVGKPEILGAGENGRRCFIRQGAIAKSDVVLSVVHEDDIEKTRECVASIIGQPEAIVGILVVSTSENPSDFIALCDNFPSATIVQAPPGTNSAEGRRLALSVAKREGRRYLGIVGSNLVFESGALAGIVASADRYRDLRAFSGVTKFEGTGNDRRASYGLAEMNVSRDDGFLHSWLAATAFEPFRTGDTGNMFLFGPVDQFGAVRAREPQAMAGSNA